jgi:hypothetical protein
MLSLIILAIIYYIEILTNYIFWSILDVTFNGLSMFINTDRLRDDWKISLIIIPETEKGHCSGELNGFPAKRGGYLSKICGAQAK